MKDDEWNRRAANILKAELKRSGVAYEDLIRRLAAAGIDESYKGIANKINRGTFTFAFFMRCMKVLGKSSIRLDDD